MLDWTINVLCNGASQRLCYSRRDLKLLNRLRHRHKEPNSFHKGEHMSEKQHAERNFLQMFQQTCGLLMSIFVTTLLSVEADDLLSAVAANQINIECWIINPESCQWAACCLPHCPRPPLAVFP